MTKKDYFALSKLFTGLSRETSAEAMAVTVMARLGSLLQEDNPRFDAARFVAACKKEFER